jgi:hypothetical protein
VPLQDADGGPENSLVVNPWRCGRGHCITQHDWHNASHRPDTIERKPLTRCSFWRGLLLGHHCHAIGVHRHRCGRTRRDGHAVRIGQLRPEEAEERSDKEQRGEQAFQDVSIYRSLIFPTIAIYP